MTTARKLRIRAVENASGARGRGVGSIRMYSDIGCILIYSDYV